jgi:hypothetical protein
MPDEGLPAKPTRRLQPSEVQELADILLDAIGDAEGRRLARQLGENPDKYFGGQIRLPKSFEQLADAANEGRIQGGIRKVLAEALLIAAGNPKLQDFADELANAPEPAPEPEPPIDQWAAMRDDLKASWQTLLGAPPIPELRRLESRVRLLQRKLEREEDAPDELVLDADQLLDRIQLATRPPPAAHAAAPVGMDALAARGPRFALTIALPLLLLLALGFLAWWWWYGRDRKPGDDGADKKGVTVTPDKACSISPGQLQELHDNLRKTGLVDTTRIRKSSEPQVVQFRLENGSVLVRVPDADPLAIATEGDCSKLALPKDIEVPALGCDKVGHSPTDSLEKLEYVDPTWDAAVEDVRSACRHGAAESCELGAKATRKTHENLSASFRERAQDIEARQETYGVLRATPCTDKNRLGSELAGLAQSTDKKSACAEILGALLPETTARAKYACEPTAHTCIFEGGGHRFEEELQAAFAAQPRGDNQISLQGRTLRIRSSTALRCGPPPACPQDVQLACNRAAKQVATRLFNANPTASETVTVTKAKDALRWSQGNDSVEQRFKSCACSGSKGAAHP